MEQVKSTETPVTATKTDQTTTKASRGSTRANNMNWNASIKKCWEAAHLKSLKEMLDNKQQGTDMPLLKFGDTEVCLSWLIKGRCFSNCTRASTHKQAGPQIIAQMHALLNACGVPTSH